ncbi:MAG: DUF4968 domain-containing protein [Anaerolineae bacterium]|nr:DUF4968 domain-containing protein [Anaerolineae bacterium]
MNQTIDWKTITTSLDYLAIPLPATSLKRWVSFDRLDTGVRFHCLNGVGDPVVLQVDVVTSNVVRVRMRAGEIEARDSDLLVAPAWPAVPFEVIERTSDVVVRTERVEAVFQRYPWQMSVYAVGHEEEDAPFFSQRIDDRAYGAAYEVAPVGAYRTSDGHLAVHEAIAVQPGEAFYGFGEQFTPLNKWGQTLTSWAIDCGNVTSARSYKNIPFFMSSAGYGLFIHATAPIVYRIGSESNLTYSFDILDDQLDYFLIYEPDFKHILGRYADLTGHAPAPPKWSFGFWISRCMYETRAEVEAVVREMRARDFPCDVLSLDPSWMGDAPWCTYEWDAGRFPEPAEMMAWLRAQGIRTCVWVTPYVAPKATAFREGMEHGYFVRKADGSLSPVVEAFAGVDLGAVDFTNPNARAWFQQQLERLLDMGVAVFKTDFGEQAPVDAVYYDGRTGVEMHNLYPLLYNAAVFELTERKFGRGLTWGRSGYAGSQRYPVQWGGDSYASFDQMVGQLRGLLSYGMSGVPYCSHDIGGFDYPPAAFDDAVPEQESQPASDIRTWWDRYGECMALARESRDAEVYLRWLQFGVFSSHTRAHGKQPREPWEYGLEAEAIARRYLNLRYRLLPYLYTEAVKSSRSGLPMVRPLVLDYQDDPNTANLDLEYLFGDSFLVAPVMTRHTRRKVYLPAGHWIDFDSKKLFQGGRWIEVEAPLEKLPVWVKAGAILPLGPEMAYVGQKPLDPLTLEIYAPAASGELIIFDEDAPEIPVRYEYRGNELTVEVGPAPGEIEILVYAVKIGAARLDGHDVGVRQLPAGSRLRFDGRRSHRLIMELVD